MEREFHYKKDVLMCRKEQMVAGETSLEFYSGGSRFSLF
jgi:hypothetical protein